MSLAEFQESWTALLFDASLREQLQDGTLALPPTLSQSEAAALRSLPPARLDAVASAMRRGRAEVFFKAIPPALAQLLPPDLGRESARSYALAYPAANLFPRWQKMPLWLEYLGRAVQAHQPAYAAHILDLLGYEQTAAGLVFYHRPSPQPLTQGPRLAPQAGLTVAGPHLEDLLKPLPPEQLATLPTTPRKGYLLHQGPRQISLSSLHWSLYGLLESCRGSQTWPELVNDLILQHPDLDKQKDRLLAWEPVFLRQGALLPGQLDA